MALEIYQPTFLHEKGRRKSNQDAIYPIDGNADTKDRLFLVCDGVGGANKGEVASRMVCDLFHAYIAENKLTHLNEGNLNEALRFVEQKMSDFIANNGDCKGMATTLTLLHFEENTNAATVAWCGDSRVYHIRNGKILHVTDDHSLVNELVKRGELSEEEAATHPQKNIILRAISGSESPTKIDAFYIEDLQENDYFLLCTDGIMEGVDQRLLLTLLNNGKADIEVVKQNIKELCEHNSRDNFSMYLIKLAQVTSNAATANTTKVLDLNQTPLKNIKKPIDTSPTSEINQSNMKLVYIVATAAIFFLLVIGIYKWQDLRTEKAYNAALAKAEATSAYNDNVDSLSRAVRLYQDAQKIDNTDKAKLERTISELRLLRLHLQTKQSMQKQVDSIFINTSDTTLAKFNIDSTLLNNLIFDADEDSLQTIIKQLNAYYQIQQDSILVEEKE